MSTRSRSTPDEDIRMKDFDSPEILSADDEQTKPALGWDQKVWQPSLKKMYGNHVLNKNVRQPCLKQKCTATMFETKMYGNHV